jgi:hypothetical protein
MGLFVAFSALVIAAAAGIGAVLAGGGTTELIVALAIHAVGSVLAIVALVAALDAG